MSRQGHGAPAMGANRLQRGVAAITAILIVAVSAAAATMMLSQQSAMIDQAMMVAARAQADQYAQAGLDWARGVLAEDAARSQVDSLAEGWAQPIAALPVDRALVAGGIADEQAKFNLNNLVHNNKPSAADIDVFRDLLARLQLPAELAEAVVDWIDADQDLAGPGGAENAYYQSLPRPYHPANRMMEQVEELYRVRGFDAKTVARLRPYVTALPARTPVNVNTASDVVLAALLGVEPARAQAVAAQRLARPFESKQDFATRAAPLLGGSVTVAADHDVKSDHFLVTVRVAQDEVQLATEALIQRHPQRGIQVRWKRPRY